MNFKKTIAVILIAAMMFGMTPYSANASTWGEGDTLEDALSELNVGFRQPRLDWLVLPGLGVVSQIYTYILFDNQRTGTVDEHPVYCIDPTKGGAFEIVRITIDFPLPSLVKQAGHSSHPHS